jgi:hypothetical protein
VSRIRGTPAEFIGYVEATDEESAIKEAIKEYSITNSGKQKRLSRVGRLDQRMLWWPNVRSWRKETWRGWLERCF